MLDSHPDVAIPAETGGFIVRICDKPPLSDGGTLDIDGFLARLLQTERFRLWGLDTVALSKELHQAGPTTAPQAFRALFRFYAAAHGKSRYGEKTPNHVLRIPELAHHFRSPASSISSATGATWLWPSRRTFRPRDT